jgi:hypothetical protein
MSTYGGNRAQPHGFIEAIQTSLGDVMSRSGLVVSVLLASLIESLAVPAWAQDATSDAGKTFYDVVKPDDLKSYCIYRGEAFSTGAFMCEGRQANVCAGPDETPPSGAKPTGRAFWRNSTADKICGATD